MDTDSGRAEEHSAGDAAGRFCPTCRGPMVYTGQHRTTERGLREQERKVVWAGLGTVARPQGVDRLWARAPDRIRQTYPPEGRPAAYRRGDPLED